MDRSRPFHLTVLVVENPLPVTVRVNAAPPAVAVDGEREEMTGNGFGTGVAVGVGVGVAVGLGAVQETVKILDPVVPPPGAGVETDTYLFPIVEISEERIVAFRRVGET